MGRSGRVLPLYGCNNPHLAWLGLVAHRSGKSSLFQHGYNVVHAFTVRSIYRFDVAPNALHAATCRSWPLTTATHHCIMLAARALRRQARLTTTRSIGYKRVLVVVKFTPYEAYTQLKLQGKAPKALRWERLKERHANHQACVEQVVSVAKREADSVTVVSRDALSRHHVDDDVDLLISVGGDGTVLSSAHFVDSQSSEDPRGPVVLGVNSDPTRAHERLGACSRTSDERRSLGALCFASARNLEDVVPRAIRGELDAAIQKRHRLAVTIRGSLSETRMPPALNDILVAHPSPAAVSRFRLDRLRNDGDHLPSPDDPDEFSFNVWSSGLWVSTPTGATGVMASAGGDMGVDVNSRDLQYLVREHLVGENDDVAFVRDKSHGFVDEEHHLKVRWNSQHGRVYIDGHHTAFDLELGDQVLVSSHAAPLRIFSNVV